MMLSSLLWPDENKRRAWQEQPLPLNYFIQDLNIPLLFTELDIPLADLPIIEEIFTKLCLDEETIRYRLAVMSELVDNNAVADAIERLVYYIDSIRDTADRLNDGSVTVFNAACRMSMCGLYVDMLTEIGALLVGEKTITQAVAFQRLGREFMQLANTDELRQMASELATIRVELSSVLHVAMGLNMDSGGNVITVSIYPDRQVKEEDKSVLLQLKEKANYLYSHEALFDPFLVGSGSPTPLETELQDTLMRMYPKLESKITAFANRFKSFSPEFLFIIKEELVFYRVLSKFIRRMKRRGIAFCSPKVLPRQSKTIHVYGAVDLGLVIHKSRERAAYADPDEVIRNDYSFDEKGRIFVLTGPNGGGKTTFARSIGLVQLLFQIGSLVPAEAAEMSPVDCIFTHFPAPETVGLQKGRLGEEAERLSLFLKVATEYSLILLNETFASTRRVDTYELGRDLIKTLAYLECNGLFVTHSTELAEEVDQLNAEIYSSSRVISIIAEVDEELEGVKRTYRIIRGGPTGQGHSLDVVRRYGLTYEQILHLLQVRGLLGVC